MRFVSLTILLTCVLTACASPVLTSTSSASLPAPTSIPPATITFATSDGASIDGTLYGRGDIAVIFSVMGNCKRGWEDMADILAQNGTTALTYQWRGCRDSGSVDDAEIQKFVDDLRGAIEFMRAQGAKKIILAGASLGGCASAKLAAESKADGLIVIASPPSIPQWGFEIHAADLDVDVPKLFITAENDNTVSQDKTRALFDLAAEPKEWQTYPGSAHGTDLFEGDSRTELQEQILKFITAIAADDN